MRCLHQGTSPAPARRRNSSLALKALVLDRSVFGVQEYFSLPAWQSPAAGSDRRKVRNLLAGKQSDASGGLGSRAAGRLAVSYAASLSLGRPPRVPFSRDALALAALRAEPPSSPICCIHRREPKAPSMSAGT
jgi:hypothetical protein